MKVIEVMSENVVVRELVLIKIRVIGDTRIEII